MASISSPVANVVAEAVYLVIVALTVSLLVKTLLVQLFEVPSGSMENTLQVGDRLVVVKLWPRPLPVRSGDVIVFHDPGGWLPEQPKTSGSVARVLEFVGLLPHDADQHLVKRVIGAPGDRVQCYGDGPVRLNGVPLLEPYVVGRPCDRQLDVVVPQHAYWVMGDNRDNSADSRFNTGQRYAGFVPQSFVVGRVSAVIWPLPRLSLV